MNIKLINFHEILSQNKCMCTIKLQLNIVWTFTLNLSFVYNFTCNLK